MGSRKYSKFTFWHNIRRFFKTLDIGHIGERVYIDANVKLLRHPNKIIVGSDVMLMEGTRLCVTNPTSKILIGDSTVLGAFTYVMSSIGIEFGNNCLIAPFCYFVDAQHSFEAHSLIRSQPSKSLPIHIGNDVWIGTGAVIMAGVTIGDGAVIGAKSVVTSDIPSNAVAYGMPAKINRFRF